MSSDRPKKEDVIEYLNNDALDATRAGEHEASSKLIEAIRLIENLPTIDGVAVTLGDLINAKQEDRVRVCGLNSGFSAVHGELWVQGKNGMYQERADDCSWPTPTPATVEVKQPSAIGLIATERQRQREDEGWSESHDDDHDAGELADAAACYAMTPDTRMAADFQSDVWPFHVSAWKPTHDDRIRELVKAGALIVAEIERLQRAEQSKSDTATVEVPVERLEAAVEFVKRYADSAYENQNHCDACAAYQLRDALLADAKGVE